MTIDLNVLRATLGDLVLQSIELKSQLAQMAQAAAVPVQADAPTEVAPADTRPTAPPDE